LALATPSLQRKASFYPEDHSNFMKETGYLALQLPNFLKESHPISINVSQGETV